MSEIRLSVIIVFDSHSEVDPIFIFMSKLRLSKGHECYRTVTAAHKIFGWV